ncbi:triose-phosphate isomerase [Candidatus Woesearchaeota archaeon]|nr:MAG: triose-phosphate isomerase [Candidatus Woesearchaeota archaeon]
MDTPIIIVNFKTYEQATGKNSVWLAKELEKASIESGKSVAISVQATDIYRIKESVKIPVLAEHIDPAGLGGYTGKVTALALIESGAEGSLINHSEDRSPFQVIQDVVGICKDNNLSSIVCAKDAEEAKKLAVLSPDFIAVEPPELIGGDVSVSSAKPEIIHNTVKLVKEVNPEIKVLCGAGVKTKEDIVVALHLGADGILLASGITKAEDPKGKMLELLEGL